MKKKTTGNSFLFKDLFHNTELCVDIKLLTRMQGRIAEGDYISGVITRDGEEHFTFIEDARVKRVATVKRNPCVMEGEFINVHRRDDGTLYPTFNRPAYTEKFTFRDFCRKAAEELLAVAGLVK